VDRGTFLSPTKQLGYPGQPMVPGNQYNADFMVKDSKRFGDSGGWGWAAFEYDPASGSFRPATEADSPPQEHDAKCGFACHTIVQDRDCVFIRSQVKPCRVHLAT
jgi:Cytochrome P460